MIKDDPQRKTLEIEPVDCRLLVYIYIYTFAMFFRVPYTCICKHKIYLIDLVHRVVYSNRISLFIYIYIYIIFIFIFIIFIYLIFFLYFNIVRPCSFISNSKCPIDCLIRVSIFFLFFSQIFFPVINFAIIVRLQKLSIF